MNVSFTIARRYFFSRKSGGAFNLITVISGISLLGYLVGAAALIIVLSVFNGFEAMFVGMYNNFDSELQIVSVSGKAFDTSLLDLSKIRAIEGIAQTSEVLEEQALLRYGERQNIATVKGVDANYTTLASLDSCIVAGELLLEAGDTNYAMVGQGIAYQLALDPTDNFHRLVVYVGRRGEVDVLNPEGLFSREGIAPSAVFAVQEEVDDKYVIVPLRFLRRLLERGNELSSLEIKVHSGIKRSRIKHEIEAICGPGFKVLDRFEQREGFFKVMRSEKLISYFILFFILLVAASNSIGSLYILVSEKKKDLVMLGALGLDGKKVAAIFKYEGMLLALTGGIVGLGAGLLLCYFQQEYGVIGLGSSAAFVMSAYPVEIRWGDVVLVFFTVSLLGYVTSLYPAAKARRLLH